MISRVWISILLLLAAVGPAGAAARALRDVRGTVEAVTTEARESGGSWTVVVIRAEDGETERLGLAPERDLEAEEFSLAVGDSIRARYFTDQDPHEVQRLRNETTGRVLRLRCLHGDPLRVEPGPHRFGGPRRGK